MESYQVTPEIDKETLSDLDVRMEEECAEVTKSGEEICLDLKVVHLEVDLHLTYGQTGSCVCPDELKGQTWVIVWQVKKSKVRYKETCSKPVSDAPGGDKIVQVPVLSWEQGEVHPPPANQEGLPPANQEGLPPDKQEPPDDLEPQVNQEGLPTVTQEGLSQANQEDFPEASQEDLPPVIKEDLSLEDDNVQSLSFRGIQGQEDLTPAHSHQSLTFRWTQGEEGDPTLGLLV